MSGLLEGKCLLVTGVINHASIAFAIARQAQEQGAQIVLTGFGRLHMVEQTALRLPQPPPVIELDVTNAEHLATLAERVQAHLPRLDGVVHAIAFAPRSALGGGFLTTPWQDVATTLHVSTWSLQALIAAVLPLLQPGGAIVGLDFDATRTWPGYDWMGVAKAGLEATTRYLARELGPRQIRINLVAAGPLRTAAAHGEPSFPEIAAAWCGRAPLGWQTEDATPVARTCVALLSDWFPATTGEIVHADGGFHVVGV
ncbi:enoyl-[acyl-carrier protein] reductase I [Silvimonas terrae]|uniref:Enoyl-[acyl-carrier-protein] reductase [NADH] n=1 Tax=Silvimonas terrae TaxID=300266 RepID=A0A840RD94_9NEIS|nr:enoyl-ACP reductase FabI [Silvimonas terrae]MBB5190947.1 enoyl-[acyl-carrier protein] reductase I [Silvimonas terrae]